MNFANFKRPGTEFSIYALDVSSVFDALCWKNAPYSRRCSWNAQYSVRIALGKVLCCLSRTAMGSELGCVVFIPTHSHEAIPMLFPISTKLDCTSHSSGIPMGPMRIPENSWYGHNYSELQLNQSHRCRLLKPVGAQLPRFPSLPFLLSLSSFLVSLFLWIFPFRIPSFIPTFNVRPAGERKRTPRPFK